MHVSWMRLCYICVISTMPTSIADLSMWAWELSKTQCAAKQIKAWKRNLHYNIYVFNVYILNHYLGIRFMCYILIAIICFCVASFDSYHVHIAFSDVGFQVSPFRPVLQI